jgi:hypothetical protein
MIVRTGRDAIDTTGLLPEKEYWQPITMMVEVAYGREEILNCIRRWVKPPEDSRKHMEEIMQRCERAPETHLALRLPFKSTLLPESEEASKEATPVVDEKTKSKPSAKAAKKAAPKTAAAIPELSKQKSGETPVIAAPVSADTSTSKAGQSTDPAAGTTAPSAGQNDAAPATASATDAKTDAAMTADDSRSRRSTRKSVRISEV